MNSNPVMSLLVAFPVQVKVSKCLCDFINDESGSKFFEHNELYPAGGVYVNDLCPKLNEHVLEVPYPDPAGNQSYEFKPVIVCCKLPFL